MPKKPPIGRGVDALDFNLEDSVGDIYGARFIDTANLLFWPPNRSHYFVNPGQR